MLFSFGILATALLLSMVAAYYSVAGLVAIFSAATIPVIIMGGSLELGKIVATVWLHNNWRRVSWLFKLYLVPAVVFLMLLTSMGIFGYLSKAHSDQSLVSGDVQGRIAIYDEKIKTAKENIEADRRQLRQMDEAVDQVMARSTTEQGASKSNDIRKTQARDRAALAKSIEANQKLIGVLNEEAAPIRAEVRKVEAEVGPIKYIAALIYGDNPDANLLERAVRWMIIMIVLVFDPLALTLILAAAKQFEWARPPQYPKDDGALTEKQLTQIQATAPEPAKSYPYLYWGNFWKKPEGWQPVGPLPSGGAKITEPDDEESTETDVDVSAAKQVWKAENPNSSLKEQRRKLASGEIDELPWLANIPTKETFGPEFPAAQRRGDIHVNTKSIPHEVFKWNGRAWMKVDKDSNDAYTYNTAYINYLIAKIDSGEYDPDLLSEREREQVASQLSLGRA
jgi:hypothetical protein